MLLLDEVVETDYGQFDLVFSHGGGFDGDADRVFAGQLNGLVGAADPRGVYVVLGRRSGGSRIRMARSEGPPADDPAWEDVVEVSATVPPGSEVSWSSWAGESGGPLDVPPGHYRLRVSARGRDAGAEDEFAEDVVDEYLIELWPAPPTDDVIVRTGSENAAYWHQTWGGRR